MRNVSVLTDIHPVWWQDTTLLSLLEIDGQPERNIHLETWVEGADVSLECAKL